MKVFVPTFLLILGLLTIWSVTGQSQSANVKFDPDKAVGDAKLSVSESNIRVVPAEDSLHNLHIYLPVKRTESGSLSGSLRVQILNETDDVVAAKTIRQTIPSGTSSLDIDLESGLPIDDLIWHRLAYHFEWDDGQVNGIISMSRLLAQLEMRVLGQSEFFAGSPASIRLIVRDHSTSEPVPNAAIRIKLWQQDALIASLFDGQTNANGTVDATMNLPADLESGSYRLEINARAEQGLDRLQQNVQIKRGYKIMLTTDKPLYQPGQLIHIRTLTLQQPTLDAVAGQSILIEVEDSKGNKVFKRTQELNDFGVAAADFQLADEINMGTYKIRAQVGNATTEKSVNIERYVLPKFNISFKADKDFYQPGDKLHGEVQADYFFGKPVSEGKVEITLSKFDVGFEEFARVSGQIEESGLYTFDVDLPDYFVGQPLEQGDAFVQMAIKVTDGAEHTQEKSAMVTVAKDPLSIYVVPESGTLAKDVENRVFVLTTYPDGSAAKTSIEIEGEGVEIYDASGKLARKKPNVYQTDESGIITVRMTPTADQCQLYLKARDEQGRVSKITFDSGFLATGEASILLRPDKALYQVGETMHLTALTTRQTGTVFFDFIKDRQTILTQSVALEKGRAEVTLDIPPELSGSIRTQAYVIGSVGNIIRDSRLVYISAANDLAIDISKKMGKTGDDGTIFYHPGDDVELEFTVTDEKGHPVLAALGIQIVDEAVFALSEMQPGLEKVYFRLEQEIMQPRYEIHGFTPRDLVELPVDPEKAEMEKLRAAEVLLASADELNPYSLNVNTYEQKEELIRQKAREAFQYRVNKISEAISKYSEKYNKVPTAEQGLAELIVEKLLTQKDLLDPWGNPLQFNFYSEVLNYFNVSSWGPDEQPGTLDDLVTEQYVEWRGEKEGSFWQEWFGWVGFGRDQEVRRFAMAPDAVMEKAVMADQAMPPMPSAGAVTQSEESAAPGDAVRVREYFPETLLNVPSLITDENGKASLNFKIADSITDWRITSMANSRVGQLGSLTAGLRCFQDFFIDIDLPVSLTQNDWVSIPIAVYNYLPQAQEVRLKMEDGDWFELTGQSAEKTVTIESDAVDVVYFPIRVKKIGNHALTVYGYGEKMSDAVKRTIEVIPDGKEFLINVDNRVTATADGSGTGHVKQTLYIPDSAIDEASKIFVKVYPGVFSQLVEGLDAIFQMPFGCFEQTSSTTYPNILALDYLRTSGTSLPEIEMKAEEYINLGYQRLLSFEVDGGGFEWFGNAPANQLLTAYGLMEFHDMNRVYEIDPNVITRTQNWLVSKQLSDGSWGPDAQYLHLESWGKIKDSNLMITAYVMWSLLESGYSGPTLDKGLTYIRNNLTEAEDPYVMAFVANALVAADKGNVSTMKIFDLILENKVEQDDQIWWETGLNTAYYSHGNSANLETTAMIAQALLKWGKQSQVTNKVLNYIVAQKAPNGIWASTQGTIMSLKALLMSISNTSSDIAADVAIRINGQDVETLNITPDKADVMRLVDLKDYTKEGENTVEMIFEGSGTLMYSMVGRYYLPWEDPDVKPESDLLAIDVQYDKTELATDDIVTASVQVKMTRPGQTDMIIIDLGIPPGFEVMAGDLAEVVGTQNIQKYNLTGRQIIIYVDKLTSEQPISFTYRLKAKYPIVAQSRMSKVYEYYNPEVVNYDSPEEMKVN